MIEFMDEAELIAEFHKAGIWLEGETPETTVQQYRRLSQANLTAMNPSHPDLHFPGKVYFTSGLGIVLGGALGGLMAGRSQVQQNRDMEERERARLMAAMQRRR